MGETGTLDCVHDNMAAAQMRREKSLSVDKYCSPWFSIWTHTSICPPAPSAVTPYLKILVVTSVQVIARNRSRIVVVHSCAVSWLSDVEVDQSLNRNQRVLEHGSGLSVRLG